MSPSYLELQITSAYQRGRELSELEERPKFLNLASTAALQFTCLFGRIPEPGDILRFEHMELIAEAERYLVGEFIAAWERQITELPCPLRFDGNRLLRRVVVKLNDPPEWHEYDDRPCTREEIWGHIEADAVGEEASRTEPGKPRRFSGFVFLDDKRCRPATQQELEQNQPKATGGIVGILDGVAKRVGLQ